MHDIFEILLSREQEAEECDARKADSSNAAGFIIINNNHN
jgi:hypothetical protein